MRITKSSLDQTDKFTGFQCVAQSDHAYIHQGIGFGLSGTTGSLAAAATHSISFITPNNGKYIHWRPTGLSSTANTLQMRLAEESVMSSGNAATPKNHNRNSHTVSSVTIATAATLTTEGTILQYAQVGGGTNAGNASGGGSDGSAEEWVLKPNTTYSIRFENVGASTATVGYYNLFWYEESSGE